MIVHFEMEYIAPNPHLEFQDKLRELLTDNIKSNNFSQILHEFFHHTRRWIRHMIFHPLDLELITKNFPVYIPLFQGD